MPKFLVVLFVVFIGGISCINAQTTFVPRKVKDVKGQFGLESNFASYVKTIINFGDAKSVLADLSVKPFLMPPRRTEQNGNSISYALASCLEFYNNYNKNYKVNLSPDFVSLNLNTLGKAPSVEEALKFLVEYGTVTAQVVPYGSSAIKNAAHAVPKYTIYNYFRLFKTSDRGRQKTFEIKKSLMRGNPVLVEMKVDAGFNNLSGVEFWEGNKSEALVTQPLIVVSYDEDLGALEVQNSLGAGWGKGGYMWMKYEDFEKYAQNAFILIPN